MLWLVTWIFFISLGGSLCDSEECFRKERDSQCDRSLLPEEFPETTERLKKTCQNFQIFVGCVEDAKVRCKDETDLVYIRKFLDYMRTVCKEDNPLFRVISSNLHCIAPTARKLSQSCTEKFSEESMEKLDEHLGPYERGNYTRDVLKCLYFQMDISCQAVRFGYYCGSEVKDAFEEILSHLYAQRSDSDCPEEILKDVEILKVVFEAILLQELNLEKQDVQ